VAAGLLILAGVSVRGAYCVRRQGTGGVLATIDLSKKPSPHYWGGPMLSAPGPRRVRQTWRVPLQGEIEREARRWLAPDATGGQ
jgi:hypothetical protein